MALTGTGGSDIDVNIGGDSSGLQSAIAAGISELNSFKGAVAAAGVAVAAFGGKALKESIGAAASFEAQMTESLAVMGDVSDTMRNDMEDAARSVARETTFSAEQAGEAYYFLASAGFDAAESIEALPEVANFAAAGAIEMGDASDYATDIMQAFGYEAEELDKVTDTLTATFTNHNQTAEGMGEAMSYVAPVASEMGMEIEQASAAIGMMGDAGIKGSRAGTSLRQALASLASPSAKQAELMEELGVNATDSNGDLRDMGDILRDLEAAGVTSGQMMELFGTRAGPAMQVLLSEGGDALDEYTNQIAESGGITEQVAQDQMQSFQAQFNILLSNIRDVAIGIGQVFLPVLTALTQRLTGVVRWFAELNDRFDGLPGAIALVSTVIGGLTAAAYVLGTTFASTLVPAAGAVAAGIAAIGAPILAVGAILTAAAAAWRTDFAGIRTQVERVTAAFTDTFAPLVQLALSTVQWIIGDLAEMWRSHTAAVEGTVGRVVSLVGDQLVGRITAAGQAIHERIYSLDAIWGQHRDTVDQTIGAVIGFITSLAEQFFSYLRPVATFLVETFQAAWESAVGSIISIGETLVELVIGLGQRFGVFDEQTRTTSQVLGQLLDPFKKVELAVSGLQEVTGHLTTRWDEDFYGIRTTTETATGRIREILGGIDQSLVTEGLTSIRQTFDGELSGTRDVSILRMDEIAAGVSERLEGLVSVGQMLWDMHAEQTASTLQNLAATVIQLVTHFTAVFIDILSPFLSRAGQFWDEHGDQIIFIVGAFTSIVISLVRTLVDTLLAVIGPALDQMSQTWDDHGHLVVTAVELMADVVFGTLGWLIDSLESLIKAGTAAMEGDWSAAWSHISDIFVSTAEGIYSFATSWGGRLLSWLSGLIGDVIDHFVGMARDLVGNSVVPNMFDSILSVADRFGSDLIWWLARLAADFVRDLFRMGLDATREVRNMASDMLSAVDITGRFRSAGSALISAFARGIRNAASEATSAVSGVVDSVSSYLPGSDAETGPLADLTKQGEALPETFASGIKDEAGLVADMGALVGALASPQPAGGTGRTDRSVTVNIEKIEASGRREGREAGRELTKALEAYNVGR
ncbi:phage tail tape measure protein [Natronorarus salvus]|uniref:phage tail tape measure protein n=1 Tax=Natronorarus salvus TaxID=3117733 RepID=UPI002F261CCB